MEQIKPVYLVKYEGWDKLSTSQLQHILWVNAKFADNYHGYGGHAFTCENVYPIIRVLYAHVIKQMQDFKRMEEEYCSMVSAVYGEGEYRNNMRGLDYSGSHNGQNFNEFEASVARFVGSQSKPVFAVRVDCASNIDEYEVAETQSTALLLAGSDGIHIEQWSSGAVKSVGGGSEYFDVVKQYMARLITFGELFNTIWQGGN